MLLWRAMAIASPEAFKKMAVEARERVGTRMTQVQIEGAKRLVRERLPQE